MRVNGVTDGLAGPIEAFLDDHKDSKNALVVFEASDLPGRAALRKLFEATPHAAAIACYHDNAGDLKAVIEAQLSAAGKSATPAALAFLMGEGKLTKDFKLKLLDSSTMKFEGGYVLEGVPKEASPAYQKMLLYIDGETAQARRVLILDAQGNKNRFDFSSPVINKPVAKSEFEFTPPKGTKIIKP